MSTTYTARLNLGIPAVNDRDYNLAIDPNWTVLDNCAALGSLSVLPNTIPSATNSVKVSAGVFRASNGLDVTYAGATGVFVTLSAVTRLWLDEAGTLQTGASYPAGPIIRLASVTCSSFVTAIVDDRRYYASTGGLARIPVRTVTATTDTPTALDGLLLADATTAAIAFTLPTLTTAQAGLPLIIVKTDAVAHNVTVATASGATQTLSAQYDKVHVMWSGTAWWVI